MIIKGDKGEDFVIKRPEKFGGDIVYKDYKSIEKDFKEKKLHPADLKSGVAEEIINLLKPMKKDYDKLKKISDEAYPK